MEPHVGDADSTAGSQGAGQVGGGVALSARVQKPGALPAERGVVLSGTQVFRLVTRVAALAWSAWEPPQPVPRLC